MSGRILAQNSGQVNLDSLYNKIIQIKAPEFLPTNAQPDELTAEDKKCGFSLVTSVKSNFDLFSPEQQDLLQSILSRPTLQTSIVSPSGFFKVHYDQTGSNRPAYVASLSADQNAMEVAEALDSVFRYEVGYLGFLEPVGDNGAGGDDKYDVYIQNQSAGLYGYTEPEIRVGPVNWTSFIVIDNDYVGYYSSGINGMLVTVAHEFHHGIQVGNYSIPSDNSPYRNNDVYFYELTSTSMEEFVYDSVNDYYAYMPSYFQRPDKALPLQNGYNVAIWNLFLQKRFGFGILKQQWELIPSISAIMAINNTILDGGSSFPGELNRFGIWTYFTNVRTRSGVYFEEAANYPLITATFTIPFPSPPTGDLSSKPTANNFLLFNVSTNGDSLIAIITNGDAFEASQNANQVFSYDYTLYNNPTSGERELTSQYSSTFSAINPSFWSVSEILNTDLVRSDSVLISNVDSNEGFVYPNPFRYSTPSLIFLLGISSGTEVDFQVYSIGLNLVFSASKFVGELNYTPYIEWDGLDSNQNKLGSGVYIYVIKHGDEVIKGKVVIFNE